MPSAKILSEKQAYVADLKAKFESAVSGCVVAYGGINVENDTKLRKELREAGVDYMVVKEHHAASGCQGHFSGGPG